MSVAHLPAQGEADDRRAVLLGMVERSLGPHAGRATLDVPELAEVLRISRGCAYELVRSGGVASIAIGRRIVVPVPALVALLLGVRDDAAPTKGGAPTRTASPTATNERGSRGQP